LLWANVRILGKAMEKRTDLCQSDPDYRFLATVMGIYPIFQMGEGVVFENKIAHFVVFESKCDLPRVWTNGGLTSFCLSVRHTFFSR
jgi:hypothetical protein